MLVLQDAMDDLGIRRVASFCQTSLDFRDLVNSAQRRLLRRGDWVGTVVPIYVCVYNGCVVWPRYVQSVRKISACNQPLQVQNLWYNYMEGVHNNCGAWGYNGMTGKWMNYEGSMAQQGKSSLFQDIQGDGRLVRAYVRCPNDEGKTVTIFGTDNNGQILQTQNLDGSYSTGVVLTLPDPVTQFVSTSQYVRSIDYVLKDQTECPVDLFAYNATELVLEPLATYDPSETRPSYEKTRINFQMWNLAGASCSCLKGVMALVKLKFIPAQLPTDLLLIDNLDALKLAIQGVKLGEAGDINGERARIADSIREMNHDIEDWSPDGQFAAQDNTFGGATFGQQCF